MQFPRRRARPRPITIVNLAIASLYVIIIAAAVIACGGNDAGNNDDTPTISAYDFRLELEDEGIKQVRASDTPPNTPQFGADGSTATATPQLSQDPPATGASPPQLEWAYFTWREGEQTFDMAELPDFHVVTVTGYYNQKPPQFTVSSDGPSGISANETAGSAQEAGETIALWLRNYEFVQRNGSRQRIVTAETINNAYIAGYQNW